MLSNSYFSLSSGYQRDLISTDFDLHLREEEAIGDPRKQTKPRRTTGRWRSEYLTLIEYTRQYTSATNKTRTHSLLVEQVGA